MNTRLSSLPAWMDGCERLHQLTEPIGHRFPKTVWRVGAFPDRQPLGFIVVLRNQ